MIAGESMGISSPVMTRTPTYYLHFWLDPGAGPFPQHIPKNWTVFAYILNGTVNFGTLQNVLTLAFDLNDLGS